MRPTLYVCTNRRLGTAGSCAGGGGMALREALERLVAARQLGWEVVESGCLGHCAHGPNVKAAPGGPVLHLCRADHTEALIDALLADWPART